MKVTPLKKRSGGSYAPVNANDSLYHPFARGESGGDNSPYKYRFLRVTRFPIAGRPDSGRILVHHELTGERREFYALMFGIMFARY